MIPFCNYNVCETKVDAINFIQKDVPDDNSGSDKVLSIVCWQGGREVTALSAYHLGWVNYLYILGAQQNDQGSGFLHHIE